MMKHCFVGLTLFFCSTLSVQARAEESGPVFEDSIQSLLATKCGKCHSERVQKGGLDLSSIRGLRRGGESGEDLVGDSLDESYLWAMIESAEMPPEGQPKLDERESALIRGWIEAGGPSRLSETGEQLTQHDVLPIFLLRCTTCHGPQRQDGGLDLRSRDAMLRGGESGPALVPGDPAGSRLMQRIESQACPPRELLLKFFVRRPPATEVDLLRKWIASGAPAAEVAPDVATERPDPLVTDRDRDHWAFRPPQRPDENSSLDAFVVARLQEKGLTLSPEAVRATLIRRAYFDLIGLPPSLDEFQRWTKDSDPHWYAQMIDHLLSSPHYGERWGRYWLDLAGYADSEGGISSDPVRSVAWKYRDYVINAFNGDKPYDKFLQEQLAGDELVDYEAAAEITDEMVEKLVATGFLRMGIDETGSRTMNFVPERLKVISDALHIVSSGLMGLTVECARCHSHKYDPIPQRDYYRLKAVFQGALDEHDWHSFKTRKLDVATKEHRERVAEINPPLQRTLKKLETQEKDALAELQLALLRSHYPEHPDTDHQLTLKALKIADNNRTLHQRMLVERLQAVEVLPDEQQPEVVRQQQARVQSLAREIDRTRREMEPPVAIRALWDQGRPSPTYLLRRGEYNKPGPLVGPGVPSVLTDGRTIFEVTPPFPDGTRKTGRRLAFARWLTGAEHPLTARVMVNRIWYHHFGQGLVKDLENFGRLSDGPSHPEMLDWLAIEFVERGWSVKAMHRLIMNSRTYRQSSRISPELLEKDPENRLLSRMPLRRMDAEALRDSLLFISGKLDSTPGGIPDTVSIDREGLVSVNPTDGGGWRRSVYLQYRRTEIPTLMDTFDYPQMGPNCANRNVSNVSPQALLMMNNRHVHELSRAFASRIESMLAEDAGLDSSIASRQSQVDLVYQLALSRAPTEQERQLGTETLQELDSVWQGDLQRALQTYCHTVLNSAAFLYVD